MKTKIACFAALLLLAAPPCIATELANEALAVPLKALRRIDSPLLQDSAGIVVQSVVKGSQAEAAGLQAGDLVIRYVDRPVLSTFAFVNQVGKTSPSDRLTLVYLRQGETRSVPVQGGRLGLQLFDGSDKFPFHLAKTKLRLSPDGMTVDLHAHGRFHLTAQAGGAKPPPLAAPQTDTAAFSVTDWNNNAAPKFNGIPLALARDERARTLAIAPDASRFVLGTDSALRYYDRQGKALWQVPALTPTWAVNISADARYVVAAFFDGTLRWYGAEDGRERLALLILATQDNWLAWTPEGYYVAPNPADPRLAMEIYPALTPAARLFKPAGSAALNPAMHRPDLVMASIRGEDVARLAQGTSAPADRRTTLSLSLIDQQNLPAAHEVAAPRPMAGNSGAFFSPYTRSGAVAAWALPAPAATATPGSGSEIAGGVGSYVGKEVGNRLLNFVPFGLGGALGSQVGDAVARDATSTAAAPSPVSLDVVKAQSDLSFNTIEELAAHLYSQHSSRADYNVVLERTFAIYPDLRRLYAHGIYRSDLAASRTVASAPASAPSAGTASARDRLLQLQQLKADGLITEAEFQARRSRIIEGL